MAVASAAQMVLLSGGLLDSWWQIVSPFWKWRLMTGCEISLGLMLWDFANEMSTLLQAMAGCCVVPSHYMGQGLPNIFLHVAALCQNGLTTSKCSVVGIMTCCCSPNCFVYNVIWIYVDMQDVLHMNTSYFIAVVIVHAESYSLMASPRILIDWIALWLTSRP